MRLADYREIENWTEDDLANLPSKENDYFEYKSSKVKPDKLQQKICNAASGFWNTGGGVFIAGIDDETGKIDGGIPLSVGNTPIVDWVDKILLEVEPISQNYSRKIIHPASPSSPINPNHVVLVIAFGESFNMPHQSSDRKYYIRAGTHTEPARNYLVEAIRARRTILKPLLRAIIRFHPKKPDIFELVLITVNDAPALDVNVSFDPLPPIFEGVKDNFPLRIPIIDRQHPHTMEVGRFTAEKATFGLLPVDVKLTYQDSVGRKYTEHQLIDIKREINQVSFVGLTKGEEALEKIINQMQSINELLDRLINHFDDNSKTK
jgi:hypothetical protein